MNEKEQLKKRRELTTDQSHLIMDVLIKYLGIVFNTEDYLEFEDVTTNMLWELKEKCFYSMVNGEKYHVIEMVNDIKEYDKDFKDYPLNKDRMEWILREFHDTEYDYESFKDWVKNAMRYTEKNYEPSKY